MTERDRTCHACERCGSTISSGVEHACPLAALLARLGAIVEASCPRPWRADTFEVHAVDPTDRNIDGEIVDCVRPIGCWEDAAAIASLRNVAPELIAAAHALDSLRHEALTCLEHYRARATGGQLCGSPKMTLSTAIFIERETRSLDELASRLSEALR